MSETDRTARLEFRLARLRLSQFVLQTARAKQENLGFGWKAVPNAPSTYPDLQMAFLVSSATGHPLQVSSENTASVIFTSPEVNMAWRFVHDCAHAETRLSFTAVDEYELALWHLDQLEQAGFTRDSLEHAFLKADTLGQVLINAVGRRVPEDQEQFDLDCALHGFEAGVLRELRRQPAGGRR